MAETRELSLVNRSVISIALPDIHARVYIRVRGNYLTPSLGSSICRFEVGRVAMRSRARRD